LSERAYISGNSYYLLSGPVLLEVMMTDLATLDQSLIAATDLEPDELVRLLGAGLAGVDDGELFLEYRETESLAFDDGRLKSASFDESRGFGLRAVAGEAIGYAHSPDLSQSALRRAIDAVQPVKRGYAGTLALPPHGTNRKRYGEDNPIQSRDQAIKIAVLEQIDA
jgi:TldD protein